MLYQLSYSRNEDEDSAGGGTEQRPPADARLTCRCSATP
jgi:hypothetical protein